MADAGTTLIGSSIELVQQFGAVAATDPVSAILLALGALITGFSVLFFGILAVGGILDALASGLSG